MSSVLAVLLPEGETFVDLPSVGAFDTPDDVGEAECSGGFTDEDAAAMTCSAVRFSVFSSSLSCFFFSSTTTTSSSSCFVKVVLLFSESSDEAWWWSTRAGSGRVQARSACTRRRASCERRSVKARFCSAVGRGRIMRSRISTTRTCLRFSTRSESKKSSREPSSVMHRRSVLRFGQNVAVAASCSEVSVGWRRSAARTTESSKRRMEHVSRRATKVW
mmetsp:Transcript_24063/g.60249  ORF Transcript_24063/g.60249 Transcript_24063/m.60249 type:complete len:218 (+) Transcript_24063:1085-1738(+)